MSLEAFNFTAKFEKHNFTEEAKVYQKRNLGVGTSDNKELCTMHLSETGRYREQDKVVFANLSHGGGEAVETGKSSNFLIDLWLNKPLLHRSQ
jgi:hypothetical protein